MTSYIAPRTEKLARAMCEALDHDPNEEILVMTRTKSGELTFNDSHRSKRAAWHVFRMEAQLWIYEHSNGELLEREGEG